MHFYPLPADALNELRDSHAPLELTAPSSPTPAQTVEGQMVWDSDGDHLTVGTGAGRKTLANTDDVVTTTGDHNHTAAGGDGGLLSADGHDSFSEYTEISAPATPGSGKIRFYAKADGHVYIRDDTGAETDLAAGGGGSTTLDALSDVVITSPADEQVLTYNGTSWVNETPAAGGGGPHDHTASDGSGVLTGDEHDGYSEYAEIAAPATPASGKVRFYAKVDGHLYQKDDAGTETDLAAGGGASALNDLTDVVIAGAAGGDVLTYESGNGIWSNQAPGAAGSVVPDVFVNEFYWPLSLDLGALLDLDAHAQWHRKVGTPTGGVIYTTATAESITATYGEELLKIVAAASGDGWKTTHTYANEKRVKSGAYLAAKVAVYIVTASRQVTVSIVTSTPTTIDSAVVSAVGSWAVVDLEPGATALDGTSVDMRATMDGAGTFYLIPLGMVASPQASPTARRLPPRGTHYRFRSPGLLLNQDGAADPNVWTDVDATAMTSPLATTVQLRVQLIEPTSGYSFYLRRNGATDAADIPTQVALASPSTVDHMSEALMVLDDGGIFEYLLDRFLGTSPIDRMRLYVFGWWEWA